MMSKKKKKQLRPRPFSSTCIDKRPFRPFDYFQSPWFKLISSSATRDPTTKEGKTFRKRFRVPFGLFLELLVYGQQLGFELRPKSFANIEGIPLELKILGVLRVLGRGTCFDGIEELTGGWISIQITNILLTT